VWMTATIPAKRYTKSFIGSQVRNTDLFPRKFYCTQGQSKCYRTANCHNPALAEEGGVNDNSSGWVRRTAGHGHRIPLLALNLSHANHLESLSLIPSVLFARSPCGDL